MSALSDWELALASKARGLEAVSKIEEMLKPLDPSTRLTLSIDVTTLRELVRVYRIATSGHMRECLVHGDFVGPGEMLDQLFPESRS